MSDLRVTETQFQRMGLRDLEKKPVLHRDVIERDRMHAYVRSRIENWR